VVAAAWSAPTTSGTATCVGPRLLSMSRKTPKPIAAISRNPSSHSHQRRPGGSSATSSYGGAGGYAGGTAAKEWLLAREADSRTLPG